MVGLKKAAPRPWLASSTATLVVRIGRDRRSRIVATRMD